MQIRDGPLFETTMSQLTALVTVFKKIEKAFLFKKHQSKALSPDAQTNVFMEGYEGRLAFLTFSEPSADEIGGHFVHLGCGHNGNLNDSEQKAVEDHLYNASFFSQSNHL